MKNRTQKRFRLEAVIHNLSQKSQVCAKRMSQSYHSHQIHTKMTKMMFVKKNKYQVRLFITYDHNFLHRSFKTSLRETRRTGFYTVRHQFQIKRVFINSLHPVTPEKLGTAEIMRLLSIPYKNRKLNRLVVDEVKFSSPSNHCVSWVSWYRHIVSPNGVTIFDPTIRSWATFVVNFLTCPSWRWQPLLLLCKL